MARKAVPACVGEGMIVRHVIMRARDVVFFKGVVEASEGLACIFAERGGELIVAAPADREREVDALLEEVAREVTMMRVEER